MYTCNTLNKHLSTNEFKYFNLNYNQATKLNKDKNKMLIEKSHIINFL